MEIVVLESSYLKCDIVEMYCLIKYHQLLYRTIRGAVRNNGAGSQMI